ncbi:hypothetical protein JCM14076_10370 [Methylosoma difficile]
MSEQFLPLVSVVIATYNGERFLREQLDSIVKQSYPNIEIIAVDDGSTDGTASILAEYANRYAHFRYEVNAQNLGYQKNFEKGFLMAKGDYIAPSDQDDIWLTDKIDVLLKAIGDYAIVYCDSAFIDSQGELLGETMSEAKTLIDFDNPLMFAIGGSVPGHAMLITKKLMAETLPFPDSMMPHDYWLAFVATFTSSLKFVREVLVHYRRHDANVFGAINKKNKKRETTEQRIKNAQQRVQMLYERCPDSLYAEKQAYRQLAKSYASYSLSNNLLRMCLFFKHRKAFLSYKKHNEARRLLYCLKTFFKII